MAVKKFQAASAAKRGVKAEFEIDWQDDEGETHTQTFYCFPARATGSNVLNLTVVGQAAPSMWEYFRSIMADGFDAFKTFIDDPGHSVESEVLSEIINWAIEYDTGTPTTPSAS